MGPKWQITGTECAIWEFRLFSFCETGIVWLRLCALSHILKLTAGVEIRMKQIRIIAVFGFHLAFLLLIEAPLPTRDERASVSTVQANRQSPNCTFNSCDLPFGTHNESQCICPILS